MASPFSPFSLSHFQKVKKVKKVSVKKTFFLVICFYFQINTVAVIHLFNDKAACFEPVSEIRFL